MAQFPNDANQLMDGADVDGRNIILNSDVFAFIIWPDRWTRTWVSLTQRDGVQSDLISSWAADAIQPVTQMHRDAPVMVRLNRAGTARTLTEFWLEFNTSVDEYFRTDDRDLVAYVRDVIVLRDAVDVTPLLSVEGL
jgi:hypothetical protein